MRQGRLEEAVVEFRAAADRAPADRGVSLALAVALVALRRGWEAVEAADEYALISEDAPWALELRALARSLTGRHAEALRLLRESTRSGEPAIRLLVARTLMAKERYGETAETCAALAEDHPGLAEARLLLVEALLREGETDRARAAAEAAHATEALGVDRILIRAYVRGRTGDAAGERADLLRAVEEAPEDPRAHRILAERDLRDGDRRSARDRLERARDLSPREVRARLLLADMAEADGRGSEAMMLWEEVLVADPTDAVAANNLAFRLAERGVKLGRAVELARIAVAHRPESGDFRDTLAFALVAAGLLLEAAGEAEAALRLSPEDAGVALRTAKVFSRSGRREDAVRAARTSRDLAAEAGDARTAQEAERLLESMRER
jgi:tetratricopeptide (TPR) repeat protein